MVDDGRDGLIARAGDVGELRMKISILAGDRSMREEMGRRAREKAVGKYGWDRVGEILERVIREMLAA